MLLNPYAVLMVFVALLRCFLGVVVLGVGLAAWRAGKPATPEGVTSLENRIYLLFLVAIVLLGLNLISWPLMYLLLQSYVPQWPGIMCIYGVTQVGKGSLGAARFLPDLLRVLQASKPALVFAGGAWFVLYLLNRRTWTGPLRTGLVIGLLPLGALALADVAAEMTYLAIPKQEEFPSAGCCCALEEEDNSERFMPPDLVGDAGRPWLTAAYFGANLGLILVLLGSSRQGRSSPGALGMGLLLMGDLVVLVVSGLFLVEVAAPILLHLPYHHCAYDLIPEAPEAVAAILLFLAGCFLLGWAVLARWFGRCPETEPFLEDMVGRLLRCSMWGFLLSLAMLSLELVLA
jgi:hypothetical protein